MLKKPAPEQTSLEMVTLDSLGQGDLQAAQGDGGALLCQCQTASRAPLRSRPWPDQGQMAVPACGLGTEHQEDRNGGNESTQTCMGMRRSSLNLTPCPQANRRPTKISTQPKNKTRRKIGFVSGLSPVK